MRQEIQEMLKKEEEQIIEINEKLKGRAQKFGSDYIPITKASYNMYKIQKASETGKMQYLEGILLDDIADMQERRQKIKQRAQKFFPDVKVETNTDKFFDKKVVPDFTQDNTQIRYNSWYLFGVDYMSNDKIRQYFHLNPYFRIEWINDSSCNITFNSKEEAEAAVHPFIKGDSMKDQKDQIWYELQEYEVENVKRKLFCRLSTNRDIKKNEHHGHQSKYYQWQINKNKINNYVKKRARQQIHKTKKIHHQNSKIKVQKKQEQNSSSSVVDDSQENQGMNE